MGINWKKSCELVEYNEAVSTMERLVAEVISGESEGVIWFLEHQDVYTAGTSAKHESLLDPAKFPVYDTGRGGDYTYHGPGQRVIYFILNLKKIFAPKDPDLKKYIYYLEQIIIETLQEFGIRGERRGSRIGIWVNTTKGEKKIAAIGVRVRKWVAYHGVAINLNPILENFKGIVPCGISEYGVTSFKELGKDVEMDYLDKMLRNKIKKILKI